MDIPDSHSCAFLRRLPWLRAAAAVVSGLLLATAFPPLGWWWMAFVALVPLLALPAPKCILERLLDGARFGYAFWACSLYWLNTVGFGAGWILAIYCAIYFMLWYLFHSALLWSQKPPEVVDEGKSPASHFPGAGTAPLPPGRLLAVLLLAACAWCALEWVRAWFCTGFPWNQLGVAFAEQPILRQGADLAGLYGLSFLAFFTNAAFADAIQSACVRRWRRPALPAALVLLACAAAYGHIRSREAHPATPALRILAVQGNLPIRRAWTQEDFDFGWKRYGEATRAALATLPEPPDYVLWPEGAVPAPIVYDRYAELLRELLKETRVPMLIGALDHRVKPAAQIPGRRLSNDDFAGFDSAFLLTPDSQLLRSPFAERGEHYDKVHLVPFGEFVPFGEQFPWLREAIGMGRDRTAGRDYHLFRLGDAKVGVNICFEDAFPAISRRFTRQGAQLLVTITDDAWYLASCGSRQHRNHAIFRAVENRRPLMRSGNNSDTCLIDATGAVHDPITAPDGSPFAHGARLYTVPYAPADAPLTLYARTGNAFAWLCAVATAAALLSLARRWRSRKQRLLNAATQTAPRR